MFSLLYLFIFSMCVSNVNLKFIMNKVTTMLLPLVEIKSLCDVDI
jgi:hypothetical protein